jgi:hypothetical protein
VDWIPGFTSPESNVGHPSLASPLQHHIQLHKPIFVSQWKTSNIFSKGQHQTRNLCPLFLSFCGLFICLSPLSWVLVYGQTLPLSGHGSSE